MSRGFKRDIPATAEAYKLGTLRDKKRRSFISLDGHEIRAGVDVASARDIAIIRATDAYGVLKCKKCGVPISDYLHELSPRKAEMHHLDRKHRCWCPHNLEMWCHGCHFAADGPHPSRRA